MSKNFLDDLIKKTSRSRRPRDLEMKSSFSDTRHGNQSLSEKLLFDDTLKNKSAMKDASIVSETDIKPIAESALSPPQVTAPSLPQDGLEIPAQKSPTQQDDLMDSLLDLSDSPELQGKPRFNIDNIKLPEVDDNLNLSDMLRDFGYDDKDEAAVSEVSDKLSDSISTDSAPYSDMTSEQSDPNVSVSSENQDNPLVKIFRRSQDRPNPVQEAKNIQTSLEEMRASRLGEIKSIKAIVHSESWKIDESKLERYDSDAEDISEGSEPVEAVKPAEATMSDTGISERSEPIESAMPDEPNQLFRETSSDSKFESELGDVDQQVEDLMNETKDLDSLDVSKISFDSDDTDSIIGDEVSEIDTRDIHYGSKSNQSVSKDSDDWVLDESYGDFKFDELSITSQCDSADNSELQSVSDSWNLSSEYKQDDFDKEMRNSLVTDKQQESNDNSEDIGLAKELIESRSYLKEILALLSDTEKQYYFLGVSRIRPKNCVMKIIDFFGNPQRSLTGISLDNRVVIYLLFFTVVAEFVEVYNIDPDDIYAILFGVLGVINYREILFIEINSQLEGLFDKYSLSKKDSDNLRNIFGLMYRSVKELGL